MTTMMKMSAKAVELMNEMGGTDFQIIYQTSDDDSFGEGYTSLSLDSNGKWVFVTEDRVWEFNTKAEALTFARSCGYDIEVEAPASVHRPNLYERTRAAVYATGNRWAIENFNATH